jgi:Na+/H+ antiporter NhaD/arsenite permease-like protein
MLNTVFQSKNIFFLVLILFFGLFIVVNGMKWMGITEGMTSNIDIVTGSSTQIAKIYKF